MKQNAEYFELYDDDDMPLGTRALRSECHGNPALIHRTAHVVLFNMKGQLLLQKRTMSKDVQPGKWDTAVGGHVDPGETYEDAARREMSEELGIPSDLPINFLFKSKIRNEVESENVGVYTIVYDGPFQPDPGEIDEIRFWDKTQLLSSLGSGVFTPNLEYELTLLRYKRLL